MLWERMGTFYGQSWLQKWEGFDAEVVKADWGIRLAGVTPRQLDYAMDNLPPRFPPDAGEFGAICRRTEPHQAQPKLPPKRGPLGVPPEIRGKVDELLHSARSDPPALAWAKRYVQLWEGKRLSERQKQDMARALRVLELQAAREAEAALKRANEITNQHPEGGDDVPA